jgi:hypothetical protein
LGRGYNWPAAAAVPGRTDIRPVDARRFGLPDRDEPDRDEPDRDEPDRDEPDRDEWSVVAVIEPDCRAETLAARHSSRSWSFEAGIQR